MGFCRKYLTTLHLVGCQHILRLRSTLTPPSGKLENTMMVKFCELSNLKAYTSDIPGGGRLRHFMDVLKDAAGMDYQGALLNDSPDDVTWSWSYTEWKSGHASPFIPDVQRVLHTAGSSFVCVQSLQFGGATFEGVGAHERSSWMGGRNSAVMYRRGEAHYAGRIVQIALPTKESPASDALLVVEEYEGLSRQDAAADPYRKVPALGAMLVYSTFAPNLRVVSIRHLSGHVARTWYEPVGGPTPSKQCLVVLSLDRVRHFCFYDRMAN